MACWRKFVLLALWTASLSGCAWPRLFQPRGPIQVQRQEASYYDPYPDDKLGPEVVGGRPRDYQRPLPEAVHSQPLGPRTRAGTAAW